MSADGAAARVGARTRDWLKFKNPAAPAVKRQAECRLKAGLSEYAANVELGRR
jgi:hypothetical protein